MMQDDVLRDAVVLVFANKQDLPHAVSCSELSDKLRLNSLKNPWYCMRAYSSTAPGSASSPGWTLDVQGCYSKVL